MKTYDKVEFNPWLGMKVNLLTGKLVNNPPKHAKQYDNLYTNILNIVKRYKADVENL